MGPPITSIIGFKNINSIFLKNINKLKGLTFKIYTGKIPFRIIRHINTTSNTRISFIKPWSPSKPVKPIVPNDLFVSCTIFNKEGNVVSVSQKFPKWQFLRDHGLYPRDLRKIDSTAPDIIPSIVVKPYQCILINLLYIKALITSEQVMIFDTVSPSAAQKLGELMYDLESRFQVKNGTNNTLPFEHQVLETILINVLAYLEVECNKHITVCGGILRDLEYQIDRNKLKDLLIKSKDLTSFYQKALLIREVLDELLDNDDDLEGMCLTRKINDATDKKMMAQGLEMLLETYYYQCDEFVQQSESLIQNIKSTEEIVNIILDANRNSLMLFELKVTIYTLGFTIATLVPAFYGMNLKNFIEESNWGFYSVIGMSSIVALIMTMNNFKALRSVTRLTLMNNHSGKQSQKHLANVEFHIQKYVPTFWDRCKKWVRLLLFGEENELRRYCQYQKNSNKEKFKEWLIKDSKK
ncbi:related to Mitochondrial inner membrane magnesium transporter mrs2 [Saccharomycodes ludwigii]|uniref:Magnesium transporter n=1 Tax=Saccharomycodes ludwigii TaxID=36035 RepID=A0A376BBU7_9ASCO|nr:hypothetical protein SCDLUD_000465 [Saccharomycodes ludwigii]KAH3902871.1 hypothetical protein SCDLUD_000465 [Saccharomycodes ludwigii]SSD62163.1 related to Mitochondrial inner membrane magnesium transporter mrs2 [Saccharomycodes ludwigii]